MAEFDAFTDYTSFSPQEFDPGYYFTDPAALSSVGPAFNYSGAFADPTMNFGGSLGYNPYTQGGGGTYPAPQQPQQQFGTGTYGNIYNLPQGATPGGQQGVPGLPGAGGQQSFLDRLLAGDRGALNTAGLGIGALTTGMGLIGMLQRMVGGQPLATQKTTPAGASPTEAAAMQGALQSSQQANDLYSQLSQMLLSGQLPGNDAMVEAAFKNVISDIMDQSIQQAQERGWTGGPDLLGGPAGPIYARLASQLPGQIAGAKLGQQNQFAQNLLGTAGGMGGQAGTMGQIGASEARSRPITTTSQQGTDLLSMMQPFGQTLQGAAGLLGALNPMYMYNTTLSGAPTGGRA